ncbi:Sodium channel protein 60E [Coniochaeta hoffmannii]|uniref:Sodium channel protein 60E n=1 Tax=Coniochaeta hoffmannii TaxID=91930 RepID=A0AA38S0I7_9PEZI|nr:Sodium channel protein 60E [Coniochaeta hoffmannii]
MDEPALSLTQNQLSTLINALSSIDQRLNRIESALRLPAFNAPPQLSSTPIPLPVPVAPSASSHNHHNHPVDLGAGPNGPAMMAPVAFIPLEAPPSGYTVSSRSTMQEELDQWTIPRGYSMRIAGAKVTGKKKVRWVCYRGGEARHHRGPVDESVIQQAKAEGRRKPTTDRSSKKCGCMFKFELIETTKGSDLWVLHYPNDEHKVHNHGPSDQTSDPRARKLPHYMSVEVDQWLREGRQVSKIQEDLKARGFMNVLNTDLYNRKRMLSKHDAQGMGQDVGQGVGV